MKKYKIKTKIILIALFALITSFILFSQRAIHTEHERRYCLNGEKWNWHITLLADGTFELWCYALSSIPPETKQYYYKDDRLILEYHDGSALCFQVNSDDDTLIFQESLSCYQRGGEPEPHFEDGSVFISWDMSY